MMFNKNASQRRAAPAVKVAKAERVEKVIGDSEGDR
jgi:hypothetical protein